jgi:hypothetical protein
MEGGAAKPESASSQIYFSRSQSMKESTAVTNGAATTADYEREPHQVLRQRIGSTDYIVSVRFSATSKETLQDKLLRVIEREVLSNAE